MTQDDTPKVRSFAKPLAVCTPFEDNQAVLANAGAFADAWGADLSALCVFEPPVELDTIFGATHIRDDALQSTVLAGASMPSGAEVQEVLDKMTAELREALVADWTQALPERAPAITVKCGKPFVEIVRHALQHGNDLVVKTAEEIEGIRRYLFSSTDRHLLRKCPSPVWLWKPQGPAGDASAEEASAADAPAKVRSVLAAVDVDTLAAGEPETLMGLNGAIMETAAAVARASDAPVTVLHVWDAPEEGFVRRWSASPEVAQDYVARIEARRASDLDRLVRAWEDKAQGVSFEALSERGAPREAIPALIHARKFDLLVMGTVARTGVPGFFIGNTAEDILSGIDCSVVAVKPPGYTSPLS